MSYINKGSLPILLTLLVHIGSLRAQERFTGYWEPKVSVDYDVSGLYSHNFSLGNRNYLLDQGDFGFRVRQVELGHFSNLKIRDNQSLALGLQYRLRNNFDGGDNQFRVTQQYNLTHNPFVLRFGHRLRTEQHFHRGWTLHRFRYRFAVDFPLRGLKVDPGEPYLVGSVEQLLSVSKGASPQYDARLSGQLGWNLDQWLELQMGLEFRLEEYASGLPQGVLLLLTSAQISL